MPRVVALRYKNIPMGWCISQVTQSFGIRASAGRAGMQCSCGHRLVSAHEPVTCNHTCISFSPLSVQDLPYHNVFLIFTIK